MADFKTRIEAFVDTSQAESKLNNFISSYKNKKLDIDINLNLNQASQSIANMLNQLNNLAKNAGSNFANTFNGALGKINVQHTTDQINHLKDALSKNFNLDAASVDRVTKQINSMDIAIQNVTTRMREKNGKFDGFNITVKGIDTIGRAVTITKSYDSAAKELSNTLGTVAKAEKQMSAEQIAITSNNFASWVHDNSEALTGYAQKVQDLQTRLSQMQASGAGANAFKQIQEEIRAFQSEIDKLNNATKSMAWQSDIQTTSNNFETWVNKNKDSLVGFESQIDKFRIQLQNMTNNGATVSELQTLQKGISAFESEVRKAASATEKMASAEQIAITQNNLVAWANNNGKAMEAYGSQIRSLIAQLDQMKTSGATVSQLKAVQEQIRLLNSEAKATGDIGKTAGESFKSLFSSVADFAKSYVSVYKVFSEIRQGIQTIIGLDDALVDLQKTTTASMGELNSFYREANEIAKQYGATTQQIIQGAADWSRLGYNLTDSKTMSKLSSQFASISPGMSVEESTSSLVSVMKANLCLVA